MNIVKGVAILIFVAPFATLLVALWVEIVFRIVESVVDFWRYR